VPRVFTIDPLAARKEKVLESGSGWNEIGRIERLDPVSTKNESECDGKEVEEMATRKSPKEGAMPSISVARRDGITCFFLNWHLLLLHHLQC